MNIFLIFIFINTIFASFSTKSTSYKNEIFFNCSNKAKAMNAAAYNNCKKVFIT